MGTHDRAQLAYGMLAMSCDLHLDASKREAMLKLIRAYGNARFEQGRARESQIVAEREVDRLTEEFARRRQLREVDA